MNKPFMPHGKANQTISTSSTSASISIDPIPKSVRIVNDGTDIVFVCVGFTSATATTADTPVRANSDMIIHKGIGADVVAVICPTGTSTVYVQTGEGGL